LACFVTDINSFNAVAAYLPQRLKLDLIVKIDMLTIFNTKKTLCQFLDKLDHISPHHRNLFINGLTDDNKAELISVLNGGLLTQDHIVTAMNYLPSQLRLQFIRSINSKLFFSIVKSQVDVDRLSNLLDGSDKGLLYQYLGLLAEQDDAQNNSSADLRLAITYFDESLKNSSAPADQIAAAIHVRDSFHYAAFAVGTNDGAELENMAAKLRLVADTLDDQSMLATLVTSTQNEPLKHGQTKVAKIVTGALLAFIGVSVCVAGLTALIMTGGLSAPLTIGAFTVGIKMIIAVMT
jgi:hypothetical protein